MTEGLIPREMLYIADEVFFCGTAAEITPIRSVDRITIGKGKRGPITERLQREFFRDRGRSNAGSLRLAGACGAAGRGLRSNSPIEFPRELSLRPPPPRLTHEPRSAQKS